MDDIITIIGSLASLSGNDTVGSVTDALGAVRFLLGGFGLIVGAIQCFFGYRIFRVLSAIIGFFVGAILGGLLGGISMGSGGAILLALLFGLLGAWLAYTLYKIGVFVVCFLAGLLLGLLTGAIPLALILGIVAGVLGVVLTKPAIILATAIGGGLPMGTALELMIGGAGTVLGILFVIAGAYVQFYMEKKKNSGDQTAQLPTTPAAVSVNGKQQDESAASGLKQTFSELKTGILSAGEPRSIITNTKTTHSPKQTVLVKNETPLWMQKLPIVVTEAQIVRGEDDGSVGLNLGVQNLGNDAIVGIFLLVRCYDLLKQEVEGIEKLVIQDISLLPGALWFSERPYPLPDSSTRRYELVVQSLVLSDGTIWSNEEQTPLSPLLSQEVLTLEEELANELFIQTEKSLQVKVYRPRSIFLYQPKQEEGYWNCACGQMNLGERCLVCGVERDFLLELAQVDHLRESRQTRLAEQKRLEEERLAEQKRLEEERRQKLAEQTEAAKKKVAEVGNQTATVAKKGANKVRTFWMACITKGQTFWTACSAKTQTFWKETVLPNKKRILLVSGAAVLVLILSVGGYFGVNHYRAAQAEAARLEAERVEQEQLRAQEEEAKQEKAKALAAKEAQGLAYWEVVKKLPKMYLYDQKDSASYTYHIITGENQLDYSTWEYGISDDNASNQINIDNDEEAGLGYKRESQLLYDLRLLDFDNNGVDELLVIYGSIEQLHWQIWGYDGQRAILMKERLVLGRNTNNYSMYLRTENDGTITLRELDSDILATDYATSNLFSRYAVQGQIISEQQFGFNEELIDDNGTIERKQSDGKVMTEAQYKTIQDTWAYQEGKDTSLVSTLVELINPNPDTTFFEYVNIHVNSKTSVSDTMAKLFGSQESENEEQGFVQTISGKWDFHEEKEVPPNGSIMIYDLGMDISPNGAVSAESFYAAKDTDWLEGNQLNGFCKYDPNHATLTMYMYRIDGKKLLSTWQSSYQVKSQNDSLTLTWTGGDRFEQFNDFENVPIHDTIPLTHTRTEQ